MTLQYENIFSRFLSKITDFSFLEYDDSINRERLVSWLHSACGFSRLRKKFSTLSLNDEDAELSFSLRHSVDSQSDMEFVIGLLATAMIIAWTEPQVNDVLLTKQMLGGGDEKFYSQERHLSQLRQMLSSARVTLSNSLRDYGYLHNSYIKE